MSKEIHKKREFSEQPLQYYRTWTCARSSDGRYSSSFADTTGYARSLTTGIKYGSIDYTTSLEKYRYNECKHLSFSWNRTLTNLNGSPTDYLGLVTSDSLGTGTWFSVDHLVCGQYRFMNFPQLARSLNNFTIVDFYNPLLPTKLDVTGITDASNPSAWYLIVDLIDVYKAIYNVLGPNLSRIREYKSRQHRILQYGRQVVFKKDLHDDYRKIGFIRWYRKRTYTKTRIVSQMYQAQPTNVHYDGLTAKDLHDGNLGFQFGVLPLIDDLRTFLHTLQNWRDKYEVMLSRGHIPDNLHLKQVDLSYMKPRAYTYQQHIPLRDVSVRYTVPSVNNTWHGTALYTLSAPELNSWLNRIGQFVDAFGLLDPAAVWDIIPFSFIIDWFIDIGSWLHNNRPRMFPVDVNILDYCESLKQEMVVNVSIVNAIARFEPNSFAVPISEIDIGYFNYKHYNRKRFKPLPIDLNPKINRSFANWRRLNIASSLIAQRVPRG